MNKSPDTQANAVLVRKATRADITTLLNLIDGLAAYEKLPPPDLEAKKRLEADLFGRLPRIEAYIAEYQDKSIGYAITFESYSSFLALPSLYLEDIFVLPQFRSKGAGLALFRTLIAEAVRRGCGRMEWMVLDWNNVGIKFYERLGAAHMKEWQLYRITKRDMERILTETAG